MYLLFFKGFTHALANKSCEMNFFLHKIVLLEYIMNTQFSQVLSFNMQRQNFFIMFTDTQLTVLKKRENCPTRALPRGSCAQQRQSCAQQRQREYHSTEAGGQCSTEALELYSTEATVCSTDTQGELCSTDTKRDMCSTEDTRGGTVLNRGMSVTPWC